MFNFFRNNDREKLCPRGSGRCRKNKRARLKNYVREQATRMFVARSLIIYMKYYFSEFSVSGYKSKGQMPSGKTLSFCSDVGPENLFCRDCSGHYRIAVVKDPFEGIIKGIFNEGLINGVGLTATAGEKLSSHFLEPKICRDKWSFLNLFF